MRELELPQWIIAIELIRNAQEVEEKVLKSLDCGHGDYKSRLAGKHDQ
jgi:hypothetical protein